MCMESTCSHHFQFSLHNTLLVAQLMPRLARASSMFNVLEEDSWFVFHSMLSFWGLVRFTRFWGFKSISKWFPNRSRIQAKSGHEYETVVISIWEPILNEIWYNMDPILMNICLLNFSCKLPNVYKWKDLPCAFAVLRVRIFLFWKTQVSKKKQTRSSNKTYT